MTVKNLQASVQARLQNHAPATKRPFQELLQYYAMERFLYRLSKTPHQARFTLKGALMLHVWEAPLARATKDIDFLGRLDNSLENLERVVREVCMADVEPDGMVFDPAAVKTERIKEDADYEGVRVLFVGLLGKARVAMQIDVGFGDVVTPGAQDITYPALLDFPAPALAGYPRETVVAEKFQAMVYLRTLNSRMKDFYDVWLLSRSDLSFNSIHDLAKRAETGHIRDDTWMTDALAKERGLDIEHDRWTRAIWEAAHQSFALRRWVSENKFGPHRIVCRTPLNNIRITTFFAGEHEVRVLDPSRVELLAAIGCEVTIEG